MSEIKFACPVCGQHITCDSSSAGKPTDCPTCFRKLVVPEAAAGNGGKLILTAAEVSSRPVPAAVGAGAGASRTNTATRFSGALFVLLLVTLAAGAFVFRDKLFKRSSKTFKQAVADASASPEPENFGTSSPPFELARAPVDDPNWTLDLAAVKIPDSPANGRVHGYTFTLQRATIQGGTLSLRQGSKWPPDVGVTVVLFADQAVSLAGKTVVVDSTKPKAPKVILRWKDGPEQPATENLFSGYAMRIEFGQPSGKFLPGKIHLAATDEGKSYVQGTFNAEIRVATPRTNRPVAVTPGR